MAIIFCGKKETKEFVLKEANIRVYTLQELAYFIYNYSMLISNSFISKNLINHIDKEWGYHELATSLNIMFNKKENIANMLKLILSMSNYYTDAEISEYNNNLMELMNLDEVSFINLSGDKLFNLRKYERALNQYEKIMSKNDYALNMVGCCYAKLQVYDKAIEYFNQLLEKTGDTKYLKNLFYCYKLSGNKNEFDEKYEKLIDQDEEADWEITIVTMLLQANDSERVKEIDEIFLMGDNYIKANMVSLINTWKEQYRYIG